MRMVAHAPMRSTAVGELLQDGLARCGELRARPILRRICPWRRRYWPSECQCALCTRLPNPSHGHEHADMPHPLAMLRARRERPRSYCAAERRQEFSSSDVACRVTLRLGVIHEMDR